MAEHPYYPSSLVLPDYAPIKFSSPRITGIFLAFFIVVFAFCWKVTGRFKYLRTADRLLVAWWTITGLVYIFLKGYWAFTPEFYSAQPSNFVTRFFSEFWKEYGKGDSRFPARFTTLVIIEGFTAVVEGPASLLAAYAVLFRTPYEHPLQLAASWTKVYEVILYFSTAYFAETAITVPEPIYFWGYFVMIKGTFLVIPLIIVVRSWMHLIQAMNPRNVSMAPHKRNGLKDK